MQSDVIWNILLIKGFGCNLNDSTTAFLDFKVLSVGSAASKILLGKSICVGFVIFVSKLSFLGKVQIEDHFFPCYFDVLGDRDMDILFGLNILRRHQCSIDLKQNKWARYLACKLIF